MPRYRLTVEYDGSGFAGWQRQDNGPSVQSVLEAAILGFCGEAVTVTGAGRTDAGVHALGQVAHMDLAGSFPPATVRDALNFHLRPAAVVVLEAAMAEPDFHARFSARARAYLYRILDRPARPALDRNRVWWVPRPLDHGAMARATEVLVGRHDFTSFRSSQCQAASALKTLDRLDVIRRDQEIHIRARARSFLHNQVRIMVGSLKLIGEGRWSMADLADALAAMDRTRGGPTAPPSGLYLTEVLYG
jgi:tRNA pseudouridine38-40 synthase